MNGIMQNQQMNLDSYCSFKYKTEIQIKYLVILFSLHFIYQKRKETELRDYPCWDMHTNKKERKKDKFHLFYLSPGSCEYQRKKKNKWEETFRLFNQIIITFSNDIFIDLLLSFPLMFSCPYLNDRN